MGQYMVVNNLALKRVLSLNLNIVISLVNVLLALIIPIVRMIVIAT
jgi:hypothetical protein